jgi:hypothetical protein
MELTLMRIAVAVHAEFLVEMLEFEYFLLSDDMAGGTRNLGMPAGKLEAGIVVIEPLSISVKHVPTLGDVALAALFLPEHRLVGVRTAMARLAGVLVEI